MIELTDEMVQAAQQATCGAESDECMRDALAAVLAIVERDYEVSRRRPEHPTPRPKGYLDACGWCKATGHTCPVHVPVTWS